ncbi:MAG: aldo/keto reductase [Desulfobacterales bacterium]
MNRRTFLSVSMIGAAAAVGGVRGAHSSMESEDFPAPPPTTRKGDMLYRQLGRTDETVSLIGLGGHHIGIPDSEQESIRIIRTAIDKGLTFMDNCWDYHEGLSELRMGQALRDGYRDRVFLMTKIDGRDGRTAAKQIDESLRRLQTDHVDLMQFHEVIRLEDPDLIFAGDGALKAVLKAKEQGKIRFIGFTGHKDPLVHLRMLDMAADNGFRFDAVQMPLNVMDAHFRSFQQNVLPRLVQGEIGVLGMKSMGSGDILKSGKVSAVECLQYAMSLPTSVVITGIESMQRLDQALEAVKTFAPLDAGQMSALLKRTRRTAEKGTYELFKTGTVYDATARHPHWLGVVEKVPS